MKFHIKSRLIRVAVAGTLGLGWLGQSFGQTAGDPEATRSRFSGFANLGATYHANLDSLLGLQWDYTLLPITTVKLQGVVRAGQEFQPKLPMAYVQQTLSENLSVRAGRMRSHLFFDADSTEIGYAKTAIRGPIPPYAATSASQINHIDGLNVQWRKPLNGMLLTADGYWGGGQFTHFDVAKVPASVSQINTNGIGNVAVSLALSSGLVRFSPASAHFGASFQTRL